MKKVLLSLALFFTTVIVVSATINTSPAINYGTFGGDGTTAPKIELKADHTFHYVDNTKKNQPIDISGTWTSGDGKVQLQDVKERRVMKEFNIEREGKCLKARKGMAFYTLCNCN